MEIACRGAAPYSRSYTIGPDLRGSAMNDHSIRGAARVSRRSGLRLLVSRAGLSVLAACTGTNVAQPAPAAAPTAAKPAATTPPSVAATASATSAAAKPGVQPTSVPQAQGRAGGTLRHATTADVATLDPYLVTTNGMETSWLVFDPLTAFHATL